MMDFLAVAAANFLFIGLRAFQQLNVMHDRKLAVVPTSCAMAACEVFTIYSMAKHGWGWIVLWIGLSGGIGSLTAMWLHKRMRKEEQ